MTTHDEPTLRSGPVTTQASEPAPVMWAPGPGHAYPATAPGFRCRHLPSHSPSDSSGWSRPPVTG